MGKIAESADVKLKEAMKAHDPAIVSVMRMLKSALVNARIAHMHELSDEEERVVVRREVKKREEAAQLYRQGGDEGKAATEKAEAEALLEFLPPEMPAAEIRQTVQRVLNQAGISGPESFGKAMGLVMKELKNQASGEAISKVLKEELSKQK